VVKAEARSVPSRFRSIHIMVNGTWPLSPSINIDWCCFYYFLRNSLVALLEALFAHYSPLSWPLPFHFKKHSRKGRLLPPFLNRGFYKQAQFELASIRTFRSARFIVPPELGPGRQGTRWHGLVSSKQLLLFFFPVFLSWMVNIYLITGLMWNQCAPT